MKPARFDPNAITPARILSGDVSPHRLKLAAKPKSHARMEHMRPILSTESSSVTVSGTRKHTQRSSRNV